MKSNLQWYNSYAKYCNNTQHHIYHNKQTPLATCMKNDFQKCEAMKQTIIP